VVSPPYETVVYDGGAAEQGQRGVGEGTGSGNVVYRHPREVRERVVREARERGEGGGGGGV